MALVIDLHAGRDKDRQPSLDLLTALVADDLARVNELVLNKMESQVALIPELAGHIIAAGGKRLRPMLVLGAARLCGYDGERHIGLAACVEFIHTATLLHDDVVDESDLRRGLATANTVWGNKASVLVGDFLLSRSFQLMVIDGSIEVLTILSDASAVIAEGEVMQLITANDTETSETAYLEVIKSKTARLFSAACQLGAVLASRPAIEEEALTSFGLNLGIAFQLVDDVLDYSAPQAALGKAVGDDFREGKITLPIILAFRRGNDGERGFWRHALEKLEQEDGDLERAAALLRKHGALADTMERARHYAKLARDALDIFAAGEAKSALLEAVDFSIERSH